MQDLLRAFPNQEKDEPTFILARPYWMAFIPTGLIFLFIFVLSIAAQIAFVTNAILPLTAESITAAVLFLGIFQLIALLVFLVAVFDFYFDLVVVTDRRLVDIDQEQIFSRRINELTLDDIQDASSEITGLFPTIFGYGNLEIQTAGARENFFMANIRYPYEVRALILDLAEQAHAGKAESVRWPETEAIAVINNRLLRTPEELEQSGAILPQDLRRVPRNVSR